jgi:hypothetical protein
MLNFKISEPQYSYKNWHQIFSTVKFAEQNSRFLPFLGGICMGGTLRMSNFKILSIFSGFRTHHNYQKWHQVCSTVKFAEQKSRSLPFLGGIWIGVPLWCEISKFWLFFLVFGPQYSYQKWHQVCSTVKFAEQNLRFNLSKSKFVWGVPLGCQVSEFWVRGASS